MKTIAIQRNGAGTFTARPLRQIVRKNRRIRRLYGSYGYANPSLKLDYVPKSVTVNLILNEDMNNGFIVSPKRLMKKAIKTWEEVVDA